MANRNRTAGCNLERLIVNELRELGYDVVTARAESRNMDNRGIDVFGDNFPYYVQCKNSQNNPNYHQLLTSELLPSDKPTLIFHRKTEKSSVKFMTKGDYVTMKKEVFYDLLTQLKNAS